PLSAEAYRWLIRHNSSSEARRRHELGQFLVMTRAEFNATQDDPLGPNAGKGPGPHVTEHQVELKQTKQLAMLASAAESRKWYEGCLEVEPRLAGFGPLFATDPSVQFCLQSARRNLGKVELAQKCYPPFPHQHPPRPS